MKPAALPIDACLDELRRRLAESDQVVLQAPPGAGKTTRVPPALLREPWLDGRSILLLQPRRWHYPLGIYLTGLGFVLAG